MNWAGAACEPTRFTIRDVPKRVAERGDPWSDIARRGRSLTEPTQRLAKLHA